MKRRLRALARHPFFVVVPLLLVFVAGWHLYQQSSRGLNTSRHNILAGGGFDHFDANGVPEDWTVNRHGTLDYSLEKTPGNVKGQALKLTTRYYQTGDLTLESAKTRIQPSQAYLYKGYYKAKGNFDLLVRQYLSNGSTHLTLVRAYGSTDDWSTASYAFKNEPNVMAVQFVYRFSSNATVQFDDTYLEASPSDAYMPNPPASSPNLMPNPDISLSTKDGPTAWTSLHLGNNQAKATYERGQANPYIRTSVTNYKDGEAKWQYAPQPVTPGQAYHFGVDYTSDVPTEVVVEYVRKDGKRQFEQLTTLSPASEWTHADDQFEVPADAATMFVSVILHRNGTIGTDNYQLNNVTRAGATQFKRPLVSFTFDDGWESAYANGARLLNAQHVPGTFYLNPSTLDTAKFMSTKQARDLQGHGHQIASHGYEHLDMTTISAHRLDREFKTASNDLAQQFGVHTPMDYASPYGKSDAQVEHYVRQYYRSQRSTTNGLNTKQNFDPYNLMVFYVGSDTKLAALQDALVQAKSQHAWLILVYHRVEHHPGDQIAVDPSVFAEQLATVKQSGIPIVTAANALNELRNQQRLP